MKFATLKTYDSSERKLQHLLLSSSLEESGSSGLVLSTILSISLTVFLLIIWASVTDIQEIAVAPGAVVPMGKIHTIANLEGGPVLSVLVKNGQKVLRDQDLVILNPELAMADLERLKSREDAREMDIVRLNAVLQNRLLTVQDFVMAAKRLNIQDQKKIAEFAEAQMKYLTERISARVYKEREAQNNIAEFQKEITLMEDQLKNLRQRELSVNSEIDIYNELEQTHAVSVINQLSTQQKFSSAKNDVLEGQRSLSKLKNQMAQELNRLNGVHTEFNSDALKELNSAEAELLELKDQIRQATERVRRTNIVAPIEGIVKGLDVMPGAVAAPGSTIVEIVPVDHQFEAEVRISTEDIGHIKIGQFAKVKVSTYNYAVYGHLNGTVNDVAAAASFDHDGQPFYKAKITLDRNYVGKDPNKNLLIPGMVLTADIATDKKSLMMYLLKPLRRTFESAFHER